ncbi:MocR-like pyridoxine biosynthesis transcription factor PdxR [Luteolibacter soli]|uniref:PLP-dependent aminotransferase family protein n=1 Tax=Luteolibacter soli TaxID=3135280 RepID=A0ABU9B2I1_9BACT
MARFPFQSDFPLGPRLAEETLVSWICREFRRGISTGRLLPGSRIPPSRVFAEQHGMARGTILEAFDQLISEGYLTTRRGSGTTVSPELPDPARERSPVSAEKSRETSRPGLSHRAKRLRHLPVSPFPLDFSDARPKAFRANQPSVAHFPIDEWSRLSSRRLRRASAEMLIGGDVLGYPPLRDALAAHLGSTRGIHCTADRIMIVSGTQQALDLVVRIVLDPGDKAWIEDPGYPGAGTVMESWGVKVIPVDVDARGLRVEKGLRAAGDARLAYVTPAHQFPLGVVMAPERRQQLLQWARESGAWIFEDDYDSEFRFSGRPIAALQSLTPDDNVIFSGSFSKMLFPSLRMGFVVLPDRLVEPMRQLRSLVDRHGPTLNQAVLCDFIAEGHFSRHLRRMRQIYAQHHEALLESAAANLADLLDVVPTETGLQTIGWLANGQQDRDIARLAAAAGIDVTPLSNYAFKWRKRNGLQLGFGSIAPKELRLATAKLARVLKKNL